jgi:hypothetical protein
VRELREYRRDGLRHRGHIALLAIALGALSLAVGIGYHDQGIAAASTSSADVAHRTSLAGGATSSNGSVCYLSAALFGHSGAPDTGGSSAALPIGTTRSGDLTVAIPPVVFVRVDGTRLVVTTNTGEPPQAEDAFYLIASGRAGTAGAGVRDHVLSACGASHGSR